MTHWAGKNRAECEPASGPLDPQSRPLGCLLGPYGERGLFPGNLARLISLIVYRSRVVRRLRAPDLRKSAPNIVDKKNKERRHASRGEKMPGEKADNVLSDLVKSAYAYLASVWNTFHTSADLFYDLCCPKGEKNKRDSQRKKSERNGVLFVLNDLSFIYLFIYLAICKTIIVICRILRIAWSLSFLMLCDSDCHFSPAGL